MGHDAKLAAVLEPLYAAALDPERLADFSAALCTATGSHVGAVMAHDAGLAGGRLDLLVGGDADAMLAYEAEFAADNIWMQRSQQRMAAGTVLDSDDVASRSELKRTRYYNEYLRQGDVEQSLALCAQADAEGIVVATLCRAGSLPAYRARDLALAREVAPHWANVYAIQRRLSWLQQRVRTLEAAVDATPMAMVVLDARMRVLRSNAAAEDLFAQRTLLRLEGGRPESMDGAGALRLAIHEAVAGVHVDGAAVRRAGKTMLRDATGRSALVANVHPLQGIGDGDGAAVLFLQPMGACPGRDVAMTMRQLFGLTPSEAALAAALHTTADVALAALECGIAVATAQTRLKLVYDKTGERGQPALMRLLSAVAAICG